MLMAKFMSIAEPNTSSDIETCGVLTGRLAQNRFKLTHLIIPKQSGNTIFYILFNIKEPLE